ncbi:MAG TPA: DUF3105 domain-containing protein [Polyangiaceae bacterium]|nr:DUF3105 domain-containing protein [Polyangiaceae bacterium]
MLERHPRLARLFAAGSLALLGSGCGPDIEAAPGEPQGACNAVETTYKNGSRDHVELCSSVDYEMSPPVFGDHYPNWAAFMTYDYPVPLGYLVHSLEHGAVVVFYDCPEECLDEVAEVQAAIDSWPADPLCSLDIKHRVILVPSPGLGVRWAAAAWGYSIKADCFDAELFANFYARHVGNAPEDLCNQGDVIAPGACQ